MAFTAIQNDRDILGFSQRQDLYQVYAREAAVENGLQRNAGVHLVSVASGSNPALGTTTRCTPQSGGLTNTGPS